ncbi:MAG: tetratricopeptide repeat protein [Bacteroidota bacterium]
MKTENNISQELLERVERYLNNELSKQELEEFESQMQTDANFRIKVEDINSLLLGIQNQSLKEELDKFHKDIPEGKVRPLNAQGYSQWRKFAAAAVILLAVTGFWWFSTPTHERLYDDYFIADPGLPTVMGDNDAETYDFYHGMVDYKQGNYDKAIAAWEALKTTQKQNDTLDYFLGVAHLAKGNTANAIDFLNTVCEKEGFVLSEDCDYYLGLAYLKQGNIERAKTSLEKSDSEKAIALLSELQ